MRAHELTGDVKPQTAHRAAWRGSSERVEDLGQDVGSAIPAREGQRLVELAARLRELAFPLMTEGEVQDRAAAGVEAMALRQLEARLGHLPLRSSVYASAGKGPLPAPRLPGWARGRPAASSPAGRKASPRIAATRAAHASSDHQPPCRPGWSSAKSARLGVGATSRPIPSTTRPSVRGPRVRRRTRW